MHLAKEVKISSTVYSKQAKVFYQRTYQPSITPPASTYQLGITPPASTYQPGITPPASTYHAA